MIETVKNWMDTKQTAEFLNVTEQRLAVWRCEGKGPVFYKLVGKVYYRPEDINAWFEANKNE